MSGRTYLDYASASPMWPDVEQVVVDALRREWANPLSVHEDGRAAQLLLDEARVSVAALIGGRPAEIYFTASGTESNNLALKGLARAYARRGRHVVVSAVEHFCVLHSARRLEREGFSVTRIDVDRWGRVDPAAVAAALTDDTVLVSVMLANNETGTLQPVRDIAEICRERGVLVHTDAVAAVGRIPVNVVDLGVDALSLAGNQFGGPPGAAALWVRQGVRLVPQLDGGGQEEGRRSGTENVPACVGLGVAAKIAHAGVLAWGRTIQPLRDELESGLLERIDGVTVNGHATHRLPTHANVCIEGIDGESAVMMLDGFGVAISSGTACNTLALKASHVLTAMGVHDELARSALLFALGPETTNEEIREAIEQTPRAVATLRAMTPSRQTQATLSEVAAKTDTV